MPSIELDCNPQFTFTQGFQPLIENNDISDKGRWDDISSNPKNNPSFELNFQYADQRLELVNEFDLGSRLDLKWIQKKENVANVKKNAEKKVRNRGKKKNVDYDEIKKNIENHEIDAINKLGDRFDKFEDRAKLNVLNFDAFWTKYAVGDRNWINADDKSKSKKTNAKKSKKVDTSTVQSKLINTFFSDTFDKTTF